MSDTSGNLLGEAASLDPAIRTRVLALANLALDQAEFIMKYGDPVSRGKVISSFLSSFSKHMRTQETNDELESLRGEMQKLQAAVMGRVPGQDTIDGVVVVPELEVVQEVGKDTPNV